MGISQSKLKVVPVIEKQDQTARICTSDTVIEEVLISATNRRDNTFITQTDFNFDSEFECRPLVSLHSVTLQTENKETQFETAIDDFSSQTVTPDTVDANTQTVNESLTNNEASNQNKKVRIDTVEAIEDNQGRNEDSVQECFLQNMKLEHKLSELQEINDNLKRQLTMLNKFSLVKLAQPNLQTDTPNYYQQKIINLELELINAKKKLTETCLQYTEKISKIREKHKAKQTEAAIRIFELEQEISSKLRLISGLKRTPNNRLTPIEKLEIENLKKELDNKNRLIVALSQNTQ
ncbi:hypothetical protein HDV06_004335 [Boothiomyces sp. JEL0866]|nr:hypothetical protein HDV06_004335 [Boothiomyces sp. JEL0866]